MAVVDWRADDPVAVVSMNNAAKTGISPAFVAAFGPSGRGPGPAGNEDASGRSLPTDPNLVPGIELDWMLQRVQAGDREAVRPVRPGNE